MNDKIERKCINCIYAKYNIYNTYICQLARKPCMDENTSACFDFKEKEKNNR